MFVQKAAEKYKNCILTQIIRKASFFQLVLKYKSVRCSRADGWQCSQGEWIQYLHVMQHFKEELDQKYGTNIVHLLLLCGGDALENAITSVLDEIMLWDTQHVR